ncbi:MAG TPA: ATP-dependent helicase [Polyangia bacterium]
MLAELQRRLRAERRGAAHDRAPDAPAPAPLAVPAMAPLTRALAGTLEAIRAAHPRLHDSLARLDAAQLAAVLGEEPAVLVRAPVGSGKTTVLAHKALTLHLTAGVPLRAMAILTFTNQAAAEIRGRLEDLAGAARPPAADFWLTGTFHAVARRLLARALPIARLGYRPGFGVLDEEGREALWDRLIRAHGLRVGDRRRLRARLGAAAAGGDGQDDDDLARLAALAAEEKRARNLMDFDDLIAHATTLLEGAGGAPDLPPRWIIVDEIQDCEPRELALLRALRGPATGLFAVGDPHQAIYGWRGSAPDLCARAEAELGCTTAALPVSYRSTRVILDGACAVLGAQPAGGGALVAARAGGARIVVRRHHDPVSEAAYLAGRVAELRAAGVPHGSIAVLVRLRAQGATLARALGERGVPVVEAARQDLRAEPAVAWLLDLLRAGLQADAEAAARVLTHRRYGCRDRLPRRRRGEALGLAGLRARLAAAPAAARALALCDLVAGLPAWLAHGAGDRDAALFAHLQLAALLRPASPTYADDVAAVRGALAALAARAADDPAPPPAALATALDEAALGSLAPTAGADHADAVAVMTLHAAKGREFRHVFLSGINAGIVPLAARGGPREEEEERRLLFVGLTRARDGVEISYHAHPHHPAALGEPSPLLAALPAALVDWLDAPPVAVAENQQGDGETGSRIEFGCGQRAAVCSSTVLARQRDRTQSDSPSPRLPVAAPAPPAPATPPPFRPGQAVRHPRYGAGVVTRITEAEVDCDFGPRGTRSFLTRLCPLVAMESTP